MVEYGVIMCTIFVSIHTLQCNHSYPHTYMLSKLTYDFHEPALVLVQDVEEISHQLRLLEARERADNLFIKYFKLM